ncbi:MAG: branched-chain amino acid aminotransferase [Bacteroidales bacterium]|nr:branched-chain amino acid aminotransferase [Bacteroidales bacterium]
MKNIDWKNLPFQYTRTDFNVRCYYKNGSWGKIEVTDSEVIPLHMASTCLHYGQQLFEGLKAFKGKDGQIRVFRMDKNAERLNYSAAGILMPQLPEEMFREAVEKVISLNKDYIPPYGTGASLYIRPLMIGLGPEVGVRPATDYMFMIFVTPVGPYFKEGFRPVDVMICRKYDRAAPLGTGSFKVGGNYAASLLSLKEAHEAGFATTLYLDAKEKKYIDEAGPANFFAIKGNSYITPDSQSILKSITNMSLQDLAKSMGMNIEKRKVPVDEIETFEEVGACGTAAVITPVRKIIDPDLNKIYEFCADDQPGEVCHKLYQQLTGIQCGDEPDNFNWIDIIETANK